MKKYILFVLLLCVGKIKAQSPFQGPFTLTVDISRLAARPDTLILTYGRGSAGIHKSDTVRVTGDLVTFSGTVDEPTSASVHIIQHMGLFNGTEFFLEPGPIRITSGKTLLGARVQAGAFRQGLDTLAAAEITYGKIHPLVLSAAEQNVTSADAQAYIRLDAKKQAWHYQMMDAVYEPFILRYAATSAAAVYALNKYAGDENLLIRPEALPFSDSVFQLLPPSLQTLPMAVALKARIDKAEFVTIGRTAPDFSQPDTAGHTVLLSSFRGKYVLVDFWASWCHWCRAENPNLIAAYHKYHAQNFDILNVSLDNSSYHDAWLNAIKTDHTGIWTQVCELSENNTVAALYGVQAIPQNFLIDPDGKIIAVNLQGDALNEKLAQVFYGR